MMRALRRIAPALGLCVALLPVAARADASIEGYPYFAKLLGGKDGDGHKQLVINDMAVANNGDVVVAGTVKSETLRVTSEIRFHRTVREDKDSGFVLCMDPSGKWKWGISLGNESTEYSSAALGVAVDDAYAYVVGEFYGLLYHSRLKTSLFPGDPADADEDFTHVTDAYSGAYLGTSLDPAKGQGFILKIRLSDGDLDRATQVRKGKADSTVTSSLRDVALYQDDVYVCGDVGNSNEDHVNLCGVPSAYNVQDGFLAARLAKNLQSCQWLVYSDDKGMTTDDGNYRESDATANGIAVDDAGNAYVCGAIGGGASATDDPARVWGTAFTGSVFEIKTGWDPLASGGNQHRGVQSWFLLKIGDGGVPSAVNYDFWNWDELASANKDPFSVAHSVVLAGGRVYVGGVYTGFLEAARLGGHIAIRSVHDNQTEYNEDGFLIRFDTNLAAENIIEVGTTAQIHDIDPDPHVTTMGGHPDGIFALVADTTRERLYAVGCYGGPQSFFKVAGAAQYDRALTTLGDQDAFMATVDISQPEQGGEINFGWKWVRQTADLDSYLPPPDATMVTAAIDLNRGRVYCAGVFDPEGDHNGDGQDDRPLKLGTEAKLTKLAVTLAGPDDDFVSFLTAVANDDAGEYFEQVLLEVVSPYAQAHISPGIGTFRYFKDSEITIEAPWAVYEGTDAQGAPITAVAATPDERPADITPYGTRNRCIGYTLGVGDKAESGYRYEGVLTKDSTIEFRWNREHKLIVTSVLDPPVGAGLGDEELATLGDPDPATGVNWITEGDNVRPQVTGVAGIETIGSEGLRRRFALVSYVGEGNAPSSDAAFSVSEQRLQLGTDGESYFPLEAPSALTYHWREQYEVRVRAAKPQGADMPLVFVDDGDEGTNRTGTGDFWYHHGATIEVGSLSQSQDLQLIGWEYATTNYFPRTRFVPSDGSFGDYLTSRTVDGRTCWFRPIESFEEPVAGHESQG